MEDNDVKFKYWGLVAFILTALLYAFSFPQYQIPQFAYFFTLPFLIWGFKCANQKKLLLTALGTGWLAWLCTVFFLRHIWFGLPYFAAVYGTIFLGTWLFFATIFLKKASTRAPLQRLIILLGAAGLWIIFEWIREWLFSGCPWLPLAATQWQSPVLLQILEWTGSYGLSFVLIFFNLALTSLIIRLIQKKQPNRHKFNFGFFLEGYIAISFLMICIGIFVKNLPKKENQEFAFRAGLIQTDIPATLKWEESFFWDILRIIREESFAIKNLNPDIIILSEATLPTALNSDENMRLWIESLVKEIDIPFLVGALATEDKNKWFNAIYEVNPPSGTIPFYYAKRHRTPFGEYVPLRNWLPFINKVVPVDFDLVPGECCRPMNVKIKDKEWKIGGLICYEDIFSELSRDSVLGGAQLLLVITNDAWFHFEGAAYQHAANSVLRAIEVRRPIIRCGNNGWSGWIDEYGNIRNVLLDSSGSVYFRGVGVVPIYRDISWANKLTFYVQYGNWFVLLCAILVLNGTLIAWKKDEI